MPHNNEGENMDNNQTIDNPPPWCPICKRTVFAPVTFVQQVGICHAPCVTDAAQDYIAQQPYNQVEEQG